MTSVKSYLSPKTEVRKSPIEGRGLFAKESIQKGEIVGIKGGHIVDKQTLDKLHPVIGDSYLQIADDHFVAPTTKEEVEQSMMFLNHTCEPNVGVKGNIVFVAIRDIASGEELTVDYAMIDDFEGDEMECHCGARDCRKIITGKDWQREDLQEKYKGYFSWYLQNKMGDSE